MRVILSKLNFLNLPPNCSLRVQRFTLTQSTRWAATNEPRNWIPPRSRLAEMSRSFAPLDPTRRDKFVLRIGDEVLLLPSTVEMRRVGNIKSLGELKFRLIKIEEMRCESLT